MSPYPIAALSRLVLSILLVGMITPVGAARADDQPADDRSVVSITADYQQAAGPFDHAKYLNANEGGYKTHNALTWLPESYPAFKQAGLRMVAITHLLNDNFYNIVSGTPPNLSYDFSRLDRVVLPLVAQGMTPLMGVAFTPAVLGGAPPSVGYSNAIPNNNALWGQVVRAMVQHYKDLGHTGWHWEVWNEPDLGLFWAGTQAQYNAMYRATVAGVKAADPTAKVGGPATANGNTAFLEQFTTFLRDNPDVPLDFASYHHYGPDPTFGISDVVKSRLDAAGRPNVPIFVTEWNINAQMDGAGAPSDTNQNASYAVRRLADAIDRPHVSKLFYFSPKEGFQPSTVMYGGGGLITVDGHKKAAYNAFKLVNRLQPTLLTTTASGPGTSDDAVGAIMTKDPGSGKVMLLAWNDQASGADLQLRLTNLPHQRAGGVKLTQYLVDATHGNYYADYAAGLRSWDVGPTENADPVDSRIVPGAATFDRLVSVEPYSLVAFELEPTDAAPTNAQQKRPAAVPVGTRNLAYGRQTAASSSVPFGWGQSKIVDGLNHTFTKVDSGAVSNGWSSRSYPISHATEWIYVDLGSRVTFDRVRLFPRDDKECEGYGFPIDFTIQGSHDATGWTTLLTRTDFNGGAPLPAPVQAQTFQVSGSYRYVRVHATQLQKACAGTSDRYFQLAELRIESDTDLAKGRTVTTSRAGVPDQLVRLAEPAEISRVDLALRSGQPLPAGFDVQLATDDACTSWRTVAVGDQPLDRFSRTFGFPSKVTRCVRVVSETGTQPSVAIKVYH
jgi:beta-xylosidase